MLGKKEPLADPRWSAVGQVRKPTPDRINDRRDVRRLHVAQTIGSQPTSHVTQQFNRIRDMFYDVDEGDEVKA